MQGVLAVNLANQGGSEGILGRSFKQEAERYAKIKPGFEVVNFDFHHECKGMRYDRRAQHWHAQSSAVCRPQCVKVFSVVFSLGLDYQAGKQTSHTSWEAKAWKAPGLLGCQLMQRVSPEVHQLQGVPAAHNHALHAGWRGSGL